MEQNGFFHEIHNLVGRLGAFVNEQCSRNRLMVIFLVTAVLCTSEQAQENERKMSGPPVL